MLAKRTSDVSVTLPSETEIRFSRFFARSPQLLFDAWTQPEHVRQWWGCEGSSIVACEMDVRVGGSWRLVMRMTDGSDHPFRGVYREIMPGERLVYTECYDVPQFGRPKWLTVVTFEAVEEGTVLTHTIRHDSREARDGHLQAGMEAGTIHTLRRLDEHTLRMRSELTQNLSTATREP
jgi:uncharacterized protein YndB with AHSA1/START domain